MCGGSTPPGAIARYWGGPVESLTRAARPNLNNMIRDRIAAKNA